MEKALSLNAYARHRKENGLPGGTRHAVQEAIASGRLSQCVTPDGKISDPDLADREWQANTRDEYVPHSGPGAAGDCGEIPELSVSRRRREAAKAALAEIELQEKAGQLVSAAEVEGELVRVFSACKTRLLAIPSRARQQDPGLTQEQLSLFEGLIREALEDLAGEAGEPNPGQFT